MPAVLRPATPADHDAIVALDRLVFPDARDEFDVASVFAAPAVVRDTQYFPVVEADGDLLGFAFLAMSKATIESHPSEPLVADPLTAELVRLVVHPGARGQGIATTLVDVVAQAAAETGYRQVVAQATEAGARRLAAAGWALTAQGATSRGQRTAQSCSRRCRRAK